MKLRTVYPLIGISLIFIAGYFIFQALNNKETPLFGTSNINSNTNADGSINLNASTSTSSSETLNANTTDARPQNTNQTGEVGPDAALFDKAYKAGDRAICDQIKSEPSKLLCNVYIINAQAKEKKDPKLCDEITDDFYRTDCHDNVIIFLAKQKKNKAKCGELIDKKRLEECAAGVQ